MNCYVNNLPILFYSNESYICLIFSIHRTTQNFKKKSISKNIFNCKNDPIILIAVIIFEKYTRGLLIDVDDLNPPTDNRLLDQINLIGV